MAKKRSSTKKISQREVPNPFRKVGLKNPINNARWSANAVFFGLLVIIILLGVLTGNAYYSGNLVTGSVISDITGAQTKSGISPITDMLKTLIETFFGSDGIIATIFKLLFSTDNWLAAAAVLMIVSGLFYLALKKTFLHGDEHNKLAVILAIALGLLAIGITIKDNNLVETFKGLFEGAIGLVVIIGIGFVLWIFTLKAMTHGSRALGEAHVAASERIAARRGQLTQREAKKSEKYFRKQQLSLNRLLASYSASYKAARNNQERKKVDIEFRVAAANSCPDLDQGEIKKDWSKAIS